MTSRDFCYWMQGYFEINGADAMMTSEQAACIRKHLALVFVHEIDPSHGPAEHQAKLNEIHNSGALDEVKKIAEDAKKTAEQAKKAASGPHHPPTFRC